MVCVLNQDADGSEGSWK